MKKEINIKKVGGGWLVTVWEKVKSDEFGQRMTHEEVFTEHQEMMDFIEVQTK